MSSERVAKRVLVADDYPEMAHSLATLMVECSCMALVTDLAFDGAEAVAKATSHPPDVVVLDIDMPVMNGVDAALAIRAALAAHPPFMIGVTGNLLHSADMRTHQAFDRVLTKPVDVDRLTDLLAEQ